LYAGTTIDRRIPVPDSGIVRGTTVAPRDGHSRLPRQSCQ